MFNQLVESCINYSELKSDQNLIKNPEEQPRVKKHQKKQAKISLKILLVLFRFFSFKFNMMISRRLSKNVKLLLEAYLTQINPERLFFLQFKPGYRYPERHYNILKFLTKIHFTFSNYFPDYCHWMFQEIFGEVNMAGLKN